MWDTSALDPDIASASYSLVLGGATGPGNSALDPGFVDPLGPDGNRASGDEDLRLMPGSPVSDAADNSALSTGVLTDLGGHARFVDDPATPDTGNGTAPVVDMGAYELQGAPCGGSYCSSTPFSTGLPSGISASSLTISVAANDLVLSADNLPDQPGQFIAAQGQAAIPFANGTLCVDPASLQRLLPITFPQGGFTSIAVDFASGAQTPSGAGPVNVLPGTTHYFQRWNRDPGVGSGSNLSNGVGVCIVP